MPTICHIGLRPSSRELLLEIVQTPEVEVEEISEAAYKKSFQSLQQAEVLLVGEEVAHPIRFAQEAYAQDRTLSILLLSDASGYEKLKLAMQFSPFIGPTVQCVSNAAGPRLAPILEDAMQRTSQRRSFARMKTSIPPKQQFHTNLLEKVRTDFTARVLEEAPIGAVLISGTGTVFSINNYALALFGKSEKEVLGNAVFDLFPTILQQDVIDFLQDGFQAAPKKLFEIVREEETQFLELSVSRIDLQASATYKLVIINNVTPVMVAQQHTLSHLEELKKVNANLARVNADLDMFVYTASHDLKSPILNIEGLVASLEEELGADHAAATPELEHIKRSISRFKQTVEDLTEVSKIQKNFEKKAVEISIAEVLEEVRHLLEREIAASRAVINLSVDACPVVFFYKRNLTSMLYNLVSNAIKYRSPARAPQIDIIAWQENGMYCLSVRDNGLGIPAARRERVFQLFKRMHSHVNGSGVGLYIVKRIVENSGGEISVESEEGKGAVFTVKLKQAL